MRTSTASRGSWARLDQGDDPAEHHTDEPTPLEVLADSLDDGALRACVPA